MTIPRLMAVVVLLAGALLLTYELGLAPMADTPGLESRPAGAEPRLPVVLEEREIELEQRVPPATSPAPIPHAEAPVTDQALSGASEAVAETKVDWQATYARMSLVELRVEQRTLTEQLDELTGPAYQLYQDTGRYEIVGGPGVDNARARITGTELRTSVCTLVYAFPAEEIRKIVLEESEYPDAYRLQRRRYLIVDAIVALRD